MLGVVATKKRHNPEELFSGKHSSTLAKRRGTAALYPTRSLSALRKSAVRLQRAVRRRLLSVKNWCDPCTLEVLRLRDAFALVEPRGAVYLFDASSLARGLLSGANFCHPFTRRPLHEVEVRRLSRAAGPSLARLLLLTWRHTASIQSAVEQRESLLTFLEGECGRFWGQLLDLKEFDMMVVDDDDSDALMENYEDAVVRLCSVRPLAATSIIDIHRQQLRRRLTWLPAVARASMEIFLRDMEALCKLRGQLFQGAEDSDDRLLGLALIPAQALARLRRQCKSQAASSR